MKYILTILMFISCGGEMQKRSYNELVGEYCSKNLRKANELLDSGDKRQYELAECIVYSGNCSSKCSIGDEITCRRAAILQEAKCKLVN